MKIYCSAYQTKANEQTRLIRTFLPPSDGVDWDTGGESGRLSNQENDF